MSEEKNAANPEQNSKHFADGLNFYKLFWIFFIGCFLGVIIETLWCLIRLHRIESRTGLIYGPFNPVYGFGAVVMTLSLYWLMKKRDLVIFIGGVIVGSVYEYFCSWLQETLFGTVSWEYSNFPFNLNGRINLLYSIFWGFLALLWVKDIYPKMTKWIRKIPNKYGKPLTWVLVLFMTINILISSFAVYRMAERHAGINTGSSIESFLDSHYPDERLQKIYPNMIHADEKLKIKQILLFTEKIHVKE